MGNENSLCLISDQFDHRLLTSFLQEMAFDNREKMTKMPAIGPKSIDNAKFVLIITYILSIIKGYLCSVGM
jgi:hypothetical protein